MPASTTDTVTGVVSVAATLLDASQLDAGALVPVIRAWVRAVNAGFFGTGQVTKDEVEASGRGAWGRLECHEVPLVALDALARMVQRPPGSGEVGATTSVRSANGQALGPASKPLTLPAHLPFELEQPDDLREVVRIEIEFHSALGDAERDAVAELLSTWDVLAETLGEPQGPDAVFEGHTRMMSPSLLEHEVIEYHPSWESLDFVVFMALRLHSRLPIARLTIE